MAEVTQSTVSLPVPFTDVLTETLRQGAQRMLATAIQAEVDEWLDARAHLQDADGRRQVALNGFGLSSQPTSPLSGVRVQAAWYGDFFIDNVEYTAVVPEPSSAVIGFSMLALGLVARPWPSRWKCFTWFRPGR